MSNLIKLKFIGNNILSGFRTGRTGSIKINNKNDQGANPTHSSPIYPLPQNQRGSPLGWTDPTLASIPLLLVVDRIQQHRHKEICDKGTSDLHLTHSTGSQLLAVAEQILSVKICLE